MVATKKTESKSEPKGELGYKVRALGRLVRVLLDALRDHMGEEEVKAIEKASGVDLNQDGKIGSGRIGMFIVAAIASLLIAGSAMAAGEDIWVLYDGNSTYGTCKVVAGSSGSATLVVDRVEATISGALSGTLTTSQLTTDGSTNATLDISMPATIPGTGTNTLGTISISSLTTGANATDAQIARFNMLRAYNDQTQLVNYASWEVTTDDVSDTSEDATIDFYVYVAGTKTKTLTIDSTGVDVVGAITATTSIDATTSLSAVTTITAGGQITGTSFGVVTGTTITASVDLMVDGRDAVTGPNTTELLVQHGTFTNGTATVTFTVPFAAGTTPSVLCDATDPRQASFATSNWAVNASSIASNTFVPNFGIAVTANALTNANYIAIGTR